MPWKPLNTKGHLLHPKETPSCSSLLWDGKSKLQYCVYVHEPQPSIRVQRQGRKKGQRSGNRLKEATATAGGRCQDEKEQLVRDQIRSRSSREVGHADGSGAVKDRGLGSCCERNEQHRGKKKQRRPMLLLQYLSLKQEVAARDDDTAVKQW
ncbi:hypothetical protein B296_00046190 [Ensete ventricosum]|uniref:Uncharacterized protein n=1 Tax=Ensete ventricosum TaxID=4639 RepID=A0A426XHS2_ENSVE|nr:hypothetical protein B296_00046190 [Ensete ventricosum]